MVDVPLADTEPVDPTDTGALLTYQGPGELPGSHMITDGQGNTQTTSFEGLPDSLKVDAINQASAPNGGHTFPEGTLGRSVTNFFTQPGTGSPSLTAVAKGGEYAPASYGQPDAPAPAVEQGKKITPEAAPNMAPATDAVMGKGPGGGGGGSSGLSREITKGAIDKEAGANTAYEKDKAIAGEQSTLGLAQSKDEGQRIADQQATDKKIQELQMAALQKASIATDAFMNSSIQPFHQDVGNRLLSAATMMASGFGAGLAHEDNMAAKAYVNQQNQDLERQKFNIQHNKEASEAYQTLFKSYTEMGLSTRQAFAATDLAITQKQQKDMSNIVLAHGGQAALAAFQNSMGDIHANDIAAKQAALAKSTAETAQAQATAAHERAETQQLTIAAGSNRSVLAAQKNLGAGHTFAQLPQDQQQGLLQHAQQSKTLVPGWGIATREVSPDEQTRAQDIQVANGLIKNIESEAKGKVFSPTAASNAELLRALIPKIMGTQGRLSPGLDQSLSAVVPTSPASPFSFTPERLGALTGTMSKIRGAFKDNLGLTEFHPDNSQHQAATMGAKPRG